MTERRDESPSVDLGALSPTDAQADRVIGAVTARLPDRPQIAPVRGDVLELLSTVPPTWIAAAAVLAIAGGAALAAASRSAAEGTSVHTTVATWATQQHVPSNAELLLTFQGYQ